MVTRLNTAPILKNLARYKTANSFNLTDFVREDIDHNKWFYLPEKVIFKNYNPEGLRYGNYVKNLRIMNELICIKLAEQIGLKAAVYKPAVYDGVKGLISYNFIKSNERKLDTITIGSLEALKIYLDEIKDSGYKFDSKQILNDMFKLIILDCLTLQVDRHCYNVMLIANKNDKTVRFGDVFDCEYSFGVDMFYGASKGLVKKFGINNDKFKFRNIIDKYDLSLIYKTNISEAYDCLTCVPIEQSDKYFQNRVFDCCEYAKYNGTMNILLDVLKNVDVKKVIEDLKKEGIIIGDYAKYADGFVNYTKKQFDKQLSLERYKKIKKDEKQLNK